MSKHVVERITSKNSRRIKEAASLFHKKYRDESGLYTVEGPKAVAEAVAFGARIIYIFFEDSSEGMELMASLENALWDESSGGGTDKPKLFIVSKEVFPKIAASKNPQGVVAVIEKRHISEGDFFSRPGHILVLDGVQDPGNLGTLVRTAEAAGFAGVIFLKGCGDIYGQKASSAAAGTLFRLPLFFCSGISEAAEKLGTSGRRILVSVVSGGKSCFETDMTSPMALVLGSEGEGVSEEALQYGEELITVPMEGDSESLNVGVAGGIMMFESLRQKGRILEEEQGKQI